MQDLKAALLETDLETNPFAQDVLNPSEDENNKYEPIFRKFDTGIAVETGSITHFCVANMTAIVVVNATRLLIYNFSVSNCHPDEFDLSTRKMRVREMYLHPNGAHILFNNQCDELVYFHINKRNFTVIYKNLNISQLCWNYQVPLLSHCVFFGTYEGYVYELEADFDSQTAKPNCRISKVLDLGDDAFGCTKNKKITGLSCHSIKESDLLLVMLSTPRNLLRFTGPVSTFAPCSLPLFVRENLKNVIELPSERSYGSLCVFPPTGSNPSHFAWSTISGVMTGKLDMTSEELKLRKRKILRFTQNATDLPLCVQLTRYHCLLLYPNRFVAINLINEEISCNHVLGNYQGVPLGLVSDFVGGGLWCYTKSHVFGYNVFEEERNVWKLLVESEQFDEALKLTENDLKNRDIVKQALASHYLQTKKYMEAAELFADTSARFAPTVLEFVDLDSKYLINYFLRKLVVYEKVVI